MSPGRGFTPGRIDDAEKLEETGVRAVRKLPDFKRGVGPTLDEFPRPRRQAGKTPWTSRGDRFARPKPQIPRKVFRLLRAPPPRIFGLSPQGTLDTGQTLGIPGKHAPSIRTSSRQPEKRALGPRESAQVLAARKSPRNPVYPEPKSVYSFRDRTGSPMTKPEESRVPGKNPAGGNETPGLREDSPSDGLSGIPFIEHWSRRPAREDGSGLCGFMIVESTILGLGGTLPERAKRPKSAKPKKKKSRKKR